jgi:hypothetical protein
VLELDAILDDRNTATGSVRAIRASSVDGAPPILSPRCEPIRRTASSFA